MHKPMPTPQTETDAWLSALLDGELEDGDGAEQIGRIARDEALQARWAEYCLIGDALRGMARPSAQLPERVRVALTAEPIVLAPRAEPHKRPTAIWLAAAATVAAVTWLTLRVEPSADVPMQMAAIAPADAKPNGAGAAGVDVLPYLVAHQDYAQALTSNPEMHFSQAALVLPGDGR